MNPFQIHHLSFLSLRDGSYIQNIIHLHKKNSNPTTLVSLKAYLSVVCEFPCALHGSACCECECDNKVFLLPLVLALPLFVIERCCACDVLLWCDDCVDDDDVCCWWWWWRFRFVCCCWGFNANLPPSLDIFLKRDIKKEHIYR